VAEHFIKSTDSRIEDTSERGNEGTVKIDAPDIDISSALFAMASNFLDASQWIKTPCAACAEKKHNISRLIVHGRDAMLMMKPHHLPFESFIGSSEKRICQRLKPYKMHKRC